LEEQGFQLTKGSPNDLPKNPSRGGNINLRFQTKYDEIIPKTEKNLASQKSVHVSTSRVSNISLLLAVFFRFPGPVGDFVGFPKE